jgi:hypothetical protein
MWKILAPRRRRGRLVVGLLLFAVWLQALFGTRLQKPIFHIVAFVSFHL